MDTHAPPTSCAERLLSIVVHNEPDHEHPKMRISEICGITRQAVYQWYKGANNEPRYQHIATLCRHYNADALWVMDGKVTDAYASSEDGETESVQTTIEDHDDGDAQSSPKKEEEDLDANVSQLLHLGNA